MKELIETTRRDKSEAKKNNLDIAKPESVVQGKEWDVDEMKKKVDSAKASLYRQQNNIEKETSRQEEEIKRIEHEIKLLKIKVKEKDKELSLANLKIKELKRNLRYTALKPLDTVSVKQQFYPKIHLFSCVSVQNHEHFELVKSFHHNLNHIKFSNFIV
jgi:septal ring factor EnvC (AmiA/AmiB activator)